MVNMVNYYTLSTFPLEHKPSILSFSCRYTETRNPKALIPKAMNNEHEYC